MGGVLCSTASVGDMPLTSNEKDTPTSSHDTLERKGGLARESEKRFSRRSEETPKKSKKRKNSGDEKRERRRSKRESFSRYSITEASHLPFEKEIEFDDEFRKVKKLGRGSFGVVWRVTRKRNGKTYACKEISKEHCSKRELDLIYLECEMMHICRHKYICRLFEVFDGRDAVCMVMEEMKGGELFDRLVEVHEFTERNCAKTVRRVFQAIAHMHSLGIVHRDLKPENLCYQDTSCTKLKVIDLGLSCYVDDCPPEACGTFEFLAPEQMLEKGYDEKIDVFALGIIVYVMMIGKSPFAVPKDELKAWEELDVWYRKMARTRIKFEGGKISKTAQRFIRGCLAIDPEDRFTAEEAANHEWLTDSVEGRSRRHTLDATALKKYQVMHRLKRGIRTLICLKRMAKLLQEENERYQRTKSNKAGEHLGDTLQVGTDKFIRADSWSVSIQHLPLAQRIKAVAHRRDSKRSAASFSEYQYQGHRQKNQPKPANVKRFPGLLGAGSPKYVVSFCAPARTPARSIAL